VAAPQSTKIALTDVAKIEQLLDEVPKRRDTAVSKQQAVSILAPRLRAMRSKGYSWHDIATWLMDHGLTVGPVALQGYLRRVREADASVEKRPGRKRRDHMRETSAGGPTPSTASTGVPGPRAQPDPAPRAPPLVKDVIERRIEPTARRSDFVVRPDTKDI